jgi:lipopolysaccharide export system protein LptA
MRQFGNVLAILVMAVAGPAVAQSQKSLGLGALGTGSKEPISIEADRLEVFDKEQRAVYSGNVVVKQGDTTMKSATMIVFYDRGAKGEKGEKGEAKAHTAEAKAEGGDAAALRKVEAKGGVTVTSKTQVATGNEGIYDRTQNKIVLTGNVALSDGPNVTKGEKLVYDLGTGVAVIERGSGGRVQGLFVPGDGEKGDKAEKGKAAKTN